MAPREGESPGPRGVGSLTEALLLPTVLVIGILFVLVFPGGLAGQYLPAIVVLILLAALLVLWAAFGSLIKEYLSGIGERWAGLDFFLRLLLGLTSLLLVLMAILLWKSPAFLSGLPLYPEATGIRYFGGLLLFANLAVLAILVLKGRSTDKEVIAWWTDMRQMNVLGIITGSMLYTGWFLTRILSIRWCWGIAMILSLFLLAAVGCLVNQRFAGVLIDEYNCMSLSRFQMVLWTLIILSAIAVVLLGRIQPGMNLESPFAVEIDWRLLALMGISVTSAAGAVLGNKVKTERIPSPKGKITFAARLKYRRERKTFEETLNKLMKTTKADETITELAKRDEVKEAVNPRSDGTKHKHTSPSEASFSDIFHGDEITDFESLSLAKVQNFYFTVVSVVIYAALLYMALPEYGAEKFPFPAIPEILLGLIAISHGGYLGDKFLPHTEEDA
ncbi:MAG: hypothetical protein LUQ62_00015 [Methanomicrobiales archaeon]|nr:hypothetical protein [Methanomicrobiales archaeon]